MKRIPVLILHVEYPGSDPWVLSVGGTTIGNISGSSFDEYVWNDPDPSDPTHWGTTGGGISDFFGLPTYRGGAGVPRSLNVKSCGLIRRIGIRPGRTTPV